MAEEFAYFIDYSQYNSDPPKCVKVAVQKATAKQVIMAERESANHYQSHWKRDDINWTPLDAWTRFREQQDKMLKQTAVELERITGFVQEANLAINALIYPPPKTDMQKLAEGKHIPSDVFDPIPAGELGSDRNHPYLVAPYDMAENGLPYGAWCKCGQCGCLGRSTLVFDFYRKNGIGKPLVCEGCIHAHLTRH